MTEDKFTHIHIHIHIKMKFLILVTSLKYYVTKFNEILLKHLK